MIISLHQNSKNKEVTTEENFDLRTESIILWFLLFIGFMLYDSPVCLSVTVNELIWQASQWHQNIRAAAGGDH